MRKREIIASKARSRRLESEKAILKMLKSGILVPVVILDMLKDRNLYANMTFVESTARKNGWIRLKYARKFVRTDDEMKEIEEMKENENIPLCIREKL